jgi:murein DD-endopeptidase MepM/ murein hydrolase activator NlpD
MIFLTGFVLGGLTMLGFVLLTPQRAPAVESVQAARVESPFDESTRFPRRIRIPLDGVSAADVQDTFDQARGSERRHEATDILAPRGTPVLAADDGVIRKLFLSKPGGITIYQFDPAEQFCYYYAHLDRYADGLREGMTVQKGDVIGYVGTTGNAPTNTPHLHFAIFQLGPEKRWWEGTPINPYPILITQAR